MARFGDEGVGERGDTCRGRGAEDGFEDGGEGGKCCWRRIDGWWCVVGIGGGGGVAEAVGESDGWKEGYVFALMLYPARFDIQCFMVEWVERGVWC